MTWLKFLQVLESVYPTVCSVASVLNYCNQISAKLNFLYRDIRDSTALER